MAHQARKRFGQHFLHDQEVISSIVQTIAPERGQSIVEIGPGQGAITVPLLRACEHLTVVELDRDLMKPLARLCASVGTLTQIQGDALRINFCELQESEQKLRLIGNLPYNISTPLLFHLITQKSCVADMHFMLQQEVVSRLAAAPGRKSYGRLSVMIQYHYQVIELFSIPPSAFDPVPAVQSAFVLLVPHPSPPVRVEDEATLEAVVKQSFSQRRKTLRNCLKGMIDDSQIIAANVDPSVRAEQLELSQFAALANVYTSANKTC